MTFRPGAITLLAAALCLAVAGCAPPPACKPGQVAAPARPTPSPAAGHHLRAHAHNDYEHTRPLLDALEQRFYSVEADVFYDGGRFKVAHGPLDASKGTLRDLYLEPLQALVNEKGSVHGDGVPFTLWIDFKDSDDKLPAALRDLLAGYPMLGRYTDAEAAPGVVRVALTGNADMKRRAVDFPERRYARDSNDYTPDDPASDNRWSYYALNWSTYVGWNGQGTMPQEDRARLACIVENAHADDRALRFYNTPDTQAVWDVSLALGVDFINTDKLAALRDFLASAP
jgi:hypothetical protein